MNNYSYIVRVLSDDWTPPEGSLIGHQPSKDGLYEIFRVPENTVYDTAHVFPSDITDLCPDAPHATHEEVKLLIETSFWKTED